MQISNPLSSSSIIVPAGSENRVLFVNGSNQIDTDSLFKWNKTTHRAGIGVAPNAGALAVAQDPVSGILMELVAGASGSNTLTITEIQPSNTASPLIFNTAGTTAGIKVIQNNNPSGVNFNELWLEGNIANRNAPVFKIVQGATPTSTGKPINVFLSGGVTSVASMQTNGVWSSTPTTSGSEAFGNAAQSSNTACSAFGDDARATGSFSAAFGASSRATGLGSTAIGAVAAATADSTTALGVASASATSAIAIGRLASAGHVDAIAIGHLATTTAINQLVIGSEAHPIEDVYFGEGVTSTTPGTTTINGTGAGALDTGGGTLRLAGGRSTGSGAGGPITFATSPAGAGGGPLNALVERARIDQLGNLILGATAPGATAQSVLALSNSAVAPTDSPNLTQLLSEDVAGATVLSVWAETAAVTEAIASDTTILIKYRGAKYKLLATLVP